MIEKAGSFARVPAGAGARAVKNGPAEDGRLEEACRRFEGIFLACLLKQSRQGAFTEKKEPFRVMEDTTLEMTAESISKSGEGFGLWRVLAESLAGELLSGEEGKRGKRG
ncbi:MAG: hypothetical protein ACC613_04190 [Synergistales bacterium]